jgi:hypothetical protein
MNSGYVGYAILQPATLIENALAGNQSTVGGAKHFTMAGRKMELIVHLFSKKLRNY